MLSKNFFSLVAFLSLALTIQALPQTDEVPARPSFTPVTEIPPPPPPLEFDGAKLVNDAAHPWRAPGPGDQRGPCPGLNTLANHGWLPRNGVVSPRDLIIAAQEGMVVARVL